MERILNNGVILQKESEFFEFVSKVKKLLSYGKILLIHEDGKEGKSAKEALQKAGYVLEEGIFTKGDIFDFSKLKEKSFSEDCRLVISVGEDYILSIAQLYASRYSVHHFAIPTTLCGLFSAIPYSTFFDTDNLIRFHSTATTTVFLAEESLKERKPREVAYALGQTLCGMLSLFDKGYEFLILGREKKAEEYFSAFLAIKELLEKNFTPFSFFQPLYESAIILANFVFSPYLGTGFNLSWLISLYKNHKVSYNENCFLAGYTVFQIYQSCLPIDGGCAMPPDTVMDIKEIEITCGISATQNLRETKSDYANDYLRREFITKDYCPELLNMLKGEWLDSLAKSYRRLMGSCGFGLKKNIYIDQLFNLTNLCGQFVDGYPLLKHLKLSGITDLLYKTEV